MDYNKKDGLKKHLELYICKNYPLIIVGYTIVYFFDKYTETIPFMTLLTLFFMMGWTYYSHMFTHIGPTMSLHSYHHDKEVCSKWNYRLLEFFIDLIFFGGIILIPVGMFFEKVFKSRMFNYYGILFWAILYASYHLNWHFLPSPNPHYYHHENVYCNYGPDILDILFGTKMEFDIIENMNTSIMNILGIFLIFLIGRKRLLPYF